MGTLRSRNEAVESELREALRGAQKYYEQASAEEKPAARRLLLNVLAEFSGLVMPRSEL